MFAHYYLVFTQINDLSQTESGNNMQLEKGQKVLVVGASSKRGHLLVEHNDITLNIPYQFLELVPAPKLTPGSGTVTANGLTSGVNI